MKERGDTLAPRWALASLPLIVLGVLGLSQRLIGPDHLALAALVLFAFATVAVMNAAVMDGLVAQCDAENGGGQGQRERKLGSGVSLQFEVN